MTTFVVALLSELQGLDVTVNTDSQKFIKQLEERTEINKCNQKTPKTY